VPVQVDLRRDVRLEELTPAAWNQRTCLLSQARGFVPTWLGLAAHVHYMGGVAGVGRNLEEPEAHRHGLVAAHDAHQQVAAKLMVEIVGDGFVFVLAVTRRRFVIGAVAALDGGRGALAEFLPAPAREPIRGPAGACVPGHVHDGARAHDVGPDIGGIQQHVFGGSGPCGAADLAMNSLDRHPFAEVVGVAADHTRVIVDPLAPADLAAVLEQPGAIVGPDQRHLGRQLQKPVAHECAALHPGVHDELGIRMGPALANDCDLAFHRFADQLGLAFGGGGDVGGISPEGTVVTATEAHGPYDFNVARVLSYGALPGGSQHIQRVGLVIRPLVDIQTQRLHVMVGDHKSAVGGGAHRRFVGKDESVRDDHVSLGAQ